MATAATIDVLLRANTAAYRSEMIAAGRTANQSLGQIRKEAASTAQSIARLNQAAAGFIGFQAMRTGINSLLQAQKSMQQIQYGLQGALGSAAAAADAYGFVAQKAKELGLNLEDAAKDFTKLTASATALGVPMRDQQKLFDGFARSATVMHLSTDQMKYALMGLSQMFAKGRISAEELRRQIGEQIPGFVPRFMQAVQRMNEGTDLAGKSFDELLKMGALATTKYMPALIEAFQMTGRGAEEAAKGLNAQLNNLSTAWFELRADVSGGLFNDVATTSVKLMADNLKELAGAVTLVAGVGISRLIGAGIASGAGSLKGVLEQTRATAALTAAHVAESEQAVVAAAIRAREMAQRKVLAAQQVQNAATQGELTIATANYSRVATAAARANATYQASLVGLRNAQLANVAAQRATTVAGGIAGAAASLGRGALALVGGPAGAFVLAAGTMAVGYASLIRKSEEASKQFRQQIDELGRLSYAVSDVTDRFRSGDVSLKEYIDNWNTAGGKIRENVKALEDLRDRERKLAEMVAGGGSRAAGIMSTPQADLMEVRNQIAAIEADIEPARAKFAEMDSILRSRLTPATYEAARAAAELGKENLADFLAALPEASRRAIEAGNAINAMLSSLDVQAWKDQVEWVRKTKGEYQGWLAEQGKLIKEAGGVEAMTAEERATFNRLAAQKRLYFANQQQLKDDKESLKVGAQKERQYDSMVDRITRQIALDKEARLLTDDMTQAQRLAITIGVELASSKNKLSEAEEKRVRALLAEAEAEGKALWLQKESVRAAESMLQLKRQLAEAEKTRRMSNDADLFSIGNGSEAVERMRRMAELQAEYQRQVELLNDKIATDPTRATAYQAELAELKAHHERMLLDEVEYQQRRAALMGDWTNGARRAFDDYMTSAKDIAGQTNQLFSNAFQGAEDALVQFVRTGKLNFSSLVDSIIADLARIAAKQMISGLLEGVAGWLFGPGGSNGGAGVRTSVGPRFSSGGYTGPGGMFQPAGVVHKGEVVWSQKDVARAGGVAAVEAMRLGLRGYAEGGAVVPMTGGSAGMGINVEVNYHGNGGKVEPRLMPDANGLRKLVIDVWNDDFANGGSTARNMASRFDVRERV